MFHRPRPPQALRERLANIPRATQIDAESQREQRPQGANRGNTTLLGGAGESETEAPHPTTKRPMEAEGRRQPTTEARRLSTPPRGLQVFTRSLINLSKSFRNTQYDTGALRNKQQRVANTCPR